MGATDFIRVEGDEVQASRFRSLVPATSTTNQQFVSTASGAGQSALAPIVMNAGYRTSGGRYQPENTTISVTNNIPTGNESVNISIDGFINGRDEGVRNLTLPFGQTSFVSLNYVANDGLDTTVIFQARYRNGNSEIEIELINHSTNFAVDGGHFNILVTYAENVVTPAVPAGRDWLRIGNTTQGQAVFSIGMLTIGSTLNFIYSVGGVFGVFDTLTAEPTGLSIANEISGVAVGGWIQTISYTGVDEQENQGIFMSLVSQSVVDITDGFIGTRQAVNTHEIQVALNARLSVLDAAGNVLNVGDVLTDLLARVTVLEP